MDISYILDNLLVKVSNDDEGIVGSGLLWYIYEETLGVLTCKHNLCTSNQVCSENCGNTCKHLAKSEAINLIHQKNTLKTQHFFISTQSDVAFIQIEPNLSQEIMDILQNKVTGLVTNQLQHNLSCYFIGYPEVTNKLLGIEPAHAFMNCKTAFVKKTNHFFDVEVHSVGDIEAIRGVSGCGIFIELNHEKLALIGIITSYKGEHLKTFVGLNPFSYLQHCFPNYSVIKVITPKKKASLYTLEYCKKRKQQLINRIDMLQNLINKIEALMPHPNPITQVQFSTQLNEKQNELNIVIMKLEGLTKNCKK